MASALGLTALPNSAAYTASKHGVIGLTRVAALEGAPDKIRVNAVCPGIIQTPLVAADLADAPTRAGLLALHPLGRFGTASDVAKAIAWLASPSNDFMTGSAIPVDGGWTGH